MTEVERWNFLEKIIIGGKSIIYMPCHLITKIDKYSAANKRKMNDWRIDAVLNFTLRVCIGIVPLANLFLSKTYWKEKNSLKKRQMMPNFLITNRFLSVVFPKKHAHTHTHKFYVFYILLRYRGMIYRLRTWRRVCVCVCVCLWNTRNKPKS